MAQVSRSLHVGSLGTATLNYSVNICLGQRMDSTAAKSDKYSYWDSDSSLHPPKQIHKMLNEKKHFTDLKGITEKNWHPGKKYLANVLKSMLTIWRGSIVEV